MTPPAVRTIQVTRYVTPLREGGSLPAIVEADDDGLYVLKFRGAGQGVKALIAELVSGEIARALGLPVPEIVFASLDRDLARTEPDPEIHALIHDSAGLNLALDFLTPVVEVIQNGRSLAFSFDTGATTTALYQEYYQLNQEEIHQLGSRDSINLGGAGGAVKIPVYKAPFEGVIGDCGFSLEAASIHLKNRVENQGIYGNLGQDVLQQFDTLSLDFRNMRIELK